MPVHVAPQGALPAHAVRVPCGAPVTGAQLPFTTSQAAHCSVHGPLQHTPSTQNPLPHSAVVVQFSPLFFLQVPVVP